MRTRRSKATNRWLSERTPDCMRTLVLIALVLLIALLIMGAGEEPEPTSAAERRAQFLAQERYYEVLDRYGDVEGAEQAADLVYKNMMEG